MTSLVLQGRTAIITGASQGLGRAIAQRFVQAGASVVLCARQADTLQQACDELRAQAGTGQAVQALAADVSSPADAAALAQAALAMTGRIDILVNNAGVYGPMGPVEEVDWGEWIRALEINIQGSVLMCRAVLPAMKAQRAGKIIQLSGGGATNPMPRISAYAVSKAAIVRFAESLALEVSEYGIDVNAMAPGALNTAMLAQVLAAGPDKVGRDFYDRSLKQQETGGAGLLPGVNLALFLASSASDGITGRLISALWDNWAQWPEHLKELGASDAYTLRRIAGRDRGLDWGDK